MAEKEYAFIKNNNVVNVVIFDNPSDELLSNFIEINELDIIIESFSNCVVGGTYDGSKFWLPQPYPSWTKNEELHKWEAPIKYPTDGEQYTWDEPTTSWLLLPPSN